MVFSLPLDPSHDGPPNHAIRNMFSALSYILVLLPLARYSNGEARIDYIDVSEYNSTYYDLSTGSGLTAELENSSRDPRPKIVFRGIPCKCEQMSCSCCAGVNLTAIKFDRHACTNFTYDPNEFSIKMTVNMNDREVYANSISAKNPPPLCIPFALFPLLSFCIRFFDISTPGRNLHACIDFETRIVGSPILILHFNCVKIGVDGISWSKPEDSLGANSIGNSTAAMLPISEPEEYDEVEFEPESFEFQANDTSTLTPEEEAQIGQLKL